MQLHPSIVSRQYKGNNNCFRQFLQAIQKTNICTNTDKTTERNTFTNTDKTTDTNTFTNTDKATDKNTF